MPLYWLILYLLALYWLILLPSVIPPPGDRLSDLLGAYAYTLPR